MKAEEIKAKISKILSDSKIYYGNFSVFPSSKKEFGDFSTNILLKIRHTEKSISSEKLISLIQNDRWMKENFERIEEKNGFLNFFLKNTLIYSVINEILSKGQDYGKSAAGNGKKVLIEFVSANPTGPLTIAHGRQAAFGEALSRILGFCGWQVTKEYYINDCGRQMDLLGISLKSRYLRLRGISAEIPEEGYHGEYLSEIAKKLPDGYEARDTRFFEEFAKQEIMAMIKNDLKEFGVIFESWFSENELRKSGKVEETIRMLENKGLIYQKDNAIWFRSTLYGDDKDRVIRKKDMTYTYLAPDIAYHQNKIERGYDLLVNLWGPDHAGYVARIKAAVNALGFSPEKLQIIIVQLTTLYRGKEKISMSTRKGQFITLKQLMDEVGPDAAKFFFLFRKADSHLDFDIEIARKKTEENPIYYIQYAYVRAKHILQFAKEKGIKETDIMRADFSLLRESVEIEILKKLKRFPSIVQKAAMNLEVSTIAPYILDLSKTFHSYYQKFRVVNEDLQISCARTAMVKCLLVVIGAALELLGISKPEKM
ncbi:MAG: arginine--tRNA ligase [Candidatus Omnitrophica bacterium]|nr:arginine--tRNA ligase [Candidatus Omnitrophota bacterium]